MTSDLSGAGEEALGKVLDERGGYGSGLGVGWRLLGGEWDIEILHRGAAEKRKATVMKHFAKALCGASKSLGLV